MKVNPREIMNSKGEPLFNEFEIKQIEHNQQICNALSFDINISTLATIQKRVIEQKFFLIKPSDYMSVRVGDNAWSTELISFKEYSTGGEFETGLINTASNNARFAETDAALDSVSVKTQNWAKQITYTLFELQYANRFNNWNLIDAKERSRKKNWDLGIQQVAFFGLASNPNVKGLLTLSNITANTTLITKYIKDMTDSEFRTFLAGLIGAYRTNSLYTEMPDLFIIPELDYNGLSAPSSATYPVKGRLEMMLDAFKAASQNPNFRIKPLALADQANNAGVSGLNKNRYVLLNSQDPDAVRMDIPVDYTNTAANTLNNVQFQSIGYGQFTGAYAYRDKSMMYFDWAV